LVDAAAKYLGERRECRFITFTFAPGREFRSAQEAWAGLFDSKRRIWGEFLRRLDGLVPGCHVAAYLEPHPGEGLHQGWPHIHAVVFYEGRLEYGELIQAWGLGGVRAEVPKGLASVSYCCKYVTKGFVPPDFAVENWSGRQHMTRTTHGFWRVLGEVPRQRVEAEFKRRAAGKTIREVRDRPMDHIHCLLRYERRGKTCYHRFDKMDVLTFVDAMNAAGWLGGPAVVFGREFSGRAEFAAPAILDYSMNCGSRDRGPPSS
jgi:hypothetical protein